MRILLWFVTVVVYISFVICNVSKQLLLFHVKCVADLLAE